MRELKIKATFAKTTEALSDVEFGRLIRGMLKYASSGEEPQLSGSERILWPAAKGEVEDQLQAFNRRSAANKKNVTKRYEPLRNSTKSTNRTNSYEFVEQRKAEEKAEEKAEKGEKKIFPLEPPLEENTQREEKEGEKEGEKKMSFRARTSTETAFDEFWAVYPKKVGKKDAFKAFQKVPVSERPLLVPAVERQKQSRQWQKDGGQFIPNPSTWLNQGRWLDEEVEQKPLWGSGKIDLSDLQSMLTGRGNA